ncbi:MAG: sodium:proton antiporter [Tyzzerella sp.]|nr:sodium:proton antiporter [Tyzzerella sp.]
MNIDRLIYIMVFMPMAGALLSYLTGRKSKHGRDVVVRLIAILEFVCSVLLILNMPGAEGSLVTVPGVCGMGLHFTVDGFRAIYGGIAAFMWMMTSVFSEEYFAHYRNRNRYYLFQLITLGATEAIFLSADLYTTFVFFEVMSMASYVWVAQDERKESLRAGATYLAVAVIGGLVMLMGLFLLYHQAGTLQISELYEACQGKNVYVAAGCLFVGFGAKAGAFPLHIWLPKAHPVAPAPASALLSGILTKTGIFGILVISCQILLHDAKWGAFVLVIGVITMFAGAFLAVFSVDFKRTLACSSVSQIGFILVGIGMQGLLAEENALAVRGTFLHMVNHSLFKLVLFMVAGVIFMNVHKLNLNEIRGFGRKKPLLAFIYLMGALGIGGVPLWSGYVSKTLLHESIVEYIHGLEAGTFAAGIFLVEDMKIFEWIFLISGGLTIAYMCKLFVAVFVEKNSDEKVQEAYDAKKNYMNPASTIALSVSAVLFPIMGSLPGMTMNRLADMSQSFMGLAYAGHEVHYFTWTNLKGSVISIAIGVAVYFLIVRTWMMKRQEDGVKVYVNKWSHYLDLEDYIYRPILLKLIPGICGFVCMILDHITDMLAKLLPIAGNVQAGFFDTISDGLIVFLRKTIYKDSPQAMELEEGNEVTHAFGTFLNKLENLLNQTIWRNHPHKKDFEHYFVLKYDAFKENTAMITRSLSYGLLLFSLGLCATLIYLLVAAMS